MRSFCRFLFLLVMSFACAEAGSAQDQPKYPNVFGPGPFETTEIEDDLYSFTHSFSRTFFLVTDEGVIVGDPINVDAAKALRGEIAKVTGQPVKYVIYSHEHWDHVLGAQVFKDEGAQIVSHLNCLDSFYRTPHPDLVMPDVVFDREYVIELGGKRVELKYFGRNHGDCLIVANLPQEKILFAVDLAMPKAVRMAGGRMMDTSPLDLIRTLREIENTIDFERYMPGHGPALAVRSEWTEVRRYHEALVDAVREEMMAGTPSGEVPGKIDLPEFKHFVGYDTDLAKNAERVRSYFIIGD